MKQTFLKFELSFLLLSATLCTIHVLAMTGECKEAVPVLSDLKLDDLFSNNKDVIQQQNALVDQRKNQIASFVAHSHNKLGCLLYKELDPLPRELIDLIVQYYSFEPTGKFIRTLRNPEKGPLHHVIMIMNDKMLAFGSHTTIEIINIKTGEIVKKININALVLSLLALSESEFFSGDEKGDIKLWNIQTGACKKTITIRDGTNPALFGINCLITLTAQRIAGCTAAGQIFILDFNKDTYSKKTINADTETKCNSLAMLSPDLFASYRSVDFTDTSSYGIASRFREHPRNLVALWNVNTGCPIKIIEIYGESIAYLSQLLPNIIVYVQVHGAEINLHHIDDKISFKTLSDWKEPRSAALTATMLSNGQIAVGLADGPVTMVNLNAVALSYKRNFEAHSDGVAHICEIGYEHIITTSRNGEMKLWQ